ncbi:ankyrin repeat domain-containing protein [uncultured Bosea sp.]|uniref:ankyrin repeat domain-containing protein n=1 Tax=uncultured Bosea sp. TaxID=211457 RepID=UPI0025F4D1A5|nr:ankyrin repeat domain-containing protein [uncultured Bosea sp.]
MARMLLIVVALVATTLAGRAIAQTPPDAAELAAYRGLHAAAASGDVVAIRSLVQAGEKLDACDGNGRTPLHVAAFRGQVGAIRALIAAGADPGLFDNQRYDAVTIVSVTDDVPALKALLASGASAKLITSRYDGTALIAAAHLGHDGIVRELIVAGAPLDHVNNLGWTALIEAVILGDGGQRHVETVRALLAAGANHNLADRQGVTPLQHARARGYTAMVALLEAGASR